MKISVKVKPGSKTEGVTRVSDTEFIVRVKAPPVDGKANEALTKALSAYFDIPKSRFHILTGHGSKIKRVEIV